MAALHPQKEPGTFSGVEKAVFVSDIHIGEPGEERAQRFVEFLKLLVHEPCQHLFLLGDIFDFWISHHRTFVHRYAEIISCLSELRKKGTEIYYFEGNHDLDLKPFWQKELGFRVFEGPQYFQLWNYQVRVEHGDQMDPDDHGYLFLRWFLRTPPLRWLGRHLPSFAVEWIGKRASQTSRAYTSEVKTINASQVREKIKRHALQAHAQRPFDYLVCGHVHVLDEQASGRFSTINLGTWLEGPAVFELTPAGGSLKRL